MSMTRPDEAIGVEVRFVPGRMRPVWFDWRGRMYHVRRVALVFDRQDGGKRYLCFSVETGGMVAELAMDRESLGWKITRVDPSVN